MIQWKSPFETVCIRPPLPTLDLYPLPKLRRMNIIVDYTVDKIIIFHKKVKKKKEKSAAKCKIDTGKHRRFKFFTIGD